MKKVLYLVMAVALVSFGAGCNKNNGNRTDEGNGNTQDPDSGKTEKPTVKTGADNLVMWLSFDDAAIIGKGDGITLDSNKGQADLGDGFIGKGWTNKGGDNTVEAYTKLNLAAGNPFTKLASFTFSAWGKLPKDKEAKGAVISFNGTGVEDMWPSFIFIFDNISDVDLDDGTKIKAQQFNGRIDFLSLEGKPAMWPNCASDVFLKKNEWFQMVRTYDAATGHWANYANGMLVNEGDFLVDEKPAGPVSAAFAADCNALYVGAWSSKVEGKSNETWQNYWAGSLDEIRMYNKAFSEEEVLNLYKEELAINLL